MEKNGCSFRKTSRDSLETSVNVFKHQNKTPSPNMVTTLYGILYIPYMIYTVDFIHCMVYTALSENESENGKKWLNEVDTKTVKIQLQSFISQY